MYSELEIAFIVILEIIGILFITVGFNYIKNKIVNHRELQDRDKIRLKRSLKHYNKYFI